MRTYLLYAAMKFFALVLVVMTVITATYVDVATGATSCSKYYRPCMQLVLGVFKS